MQQREVTDVPFRLGDSWWVLQVGDCPLTPDDQGSTFSSNQIIQASTALGRANGMSTAIHEALHAVYPFLDEDPVVEGEKAIVEVIRAYLTATGGRIVYPQLERAA